MIIVGLTGGIGSGKTTVANLFKQLNIPIYIADVEAKHLMNSSEVIKHQLTELFGDKAYLNNTLNRSFISDKIFNNKQYLDKINAIVHPQVEAHFKKWLNQHESPYVIKEAAIIFEHNKQDQYHLIISVIADEDKRISRVKKRDNSSSDKIKSIIKHQISDSEKAKQSDFVIVNNDLDTLESQVMKVHKSILNLIANSSK